MLFLSSKEKDSSPNEMMYTFYLVLVKPSSVEDSQSQDAKTTQQRSRTVLVKRHRERRRTQNEPQHAIAVRETFGATHGPGTYVEELGGSKHKLSALSEGPSKQQKVLYPAYFNPVLAHVVAMCEAAVCGIGEETYAPSDSSRQVKANDTSLVLKLLTLPQPKAPQVLVSFNGFASRSQHDARLICVPVKLWR
ncbi:mediator complex subunit rgr-1 [Culex quinquefasciatus]|uniref:Mediator complex subunit rgr-1 n=1 Tax=Culex quinquefasciatus TaxID=7176 RepID=B0XEU1_CULQU|nr:mediator complex subunit rgr-1 [Culex quinquefasciatus]|eukprot:XP_001868163.1 mediator complex subunit rgr-1 [Culex quinquefasciatus]